MIKKFFTYFILIISSCFLNSCSSPDKEFKEKVIDYSKDLKVTKGEWNELVEFIKTNKSGFRYLNKTFLSNDTLDLNKLKIYIQRVSSNTAEPGEIEIWWPPDKKKEFIFKLYLESSESMWAYDRGNKKMFKSDIIKLLQRIPGYESDENIIYVVNDDVYNYPKKFVDLIKSENIFEKSILEGDPSYTDFEKIFKSILDKTSEDQISILVTDLIYSPKDYKTKSNVVIRNEAANLTREIFKNRSSKYSVLMLNMISDYHGRYFTNRAGVKSYSGMRPYYIFIIGHRNSINIILNKKSYEKFYPFSSYLEGMKNFTLFSPLIEEKARYYTILRTYNKKGQFRPDRQNKSEQIQSMSEIKFDRRKEPVFQFSIAVDFSDLFIEPSYLRDKSNYKISSETDYEIIKIEEVDKSSSKYGNDKKLIANKSTHIITISSSIGKVLKQSIFIELLKGYPLWVIEQSSKTDLHPENLKTFGLNDIISAIYDAYYPIQTQAIYSKLKININE